MRQPVAETAEGAVVGNAKVVEAAEELEIDAGDEAVFEFGVGEAVPLAEQDGFEHGEQRIGGTAAIVAHVAGFAAGEVLFDGCPVKNTVEFDEWEAVEMFFDVVEGIGV